MNGAETLISTLNANNVDVCFANPGTSEMQLVAAIDKEKDMRAVLCLFEGVVTGAADGYGRMTDKPALTLLHLGPGLGNGTANLHNARRAFSPVLNMIGDHATYHLEYDAPLTADVEGFAKPVSDWVGTSTSENNLAETGLEALTESLRYPGRVASFIAPADHAWNAADTPNLKLIPPETPVAEADVIKESGTALSIDSPAALYLGGRALREDALHQAGRIAAKTGARIICETFTARLQRGAGRVPVERLPYFGEQASDFLKDFEAMVCVGAKPPVSFFAYPGKPSWLTPESTNLVQLADTDTDALDALTRLADALNAPADPKKLQPAAMPPVEDGKLNPLDLGKVLCAHMPEDAIVSDEAATSGLFIFPATAGAAKHDWLMLTGGAIGQGLPAALGAAIACPDRKVIALQADGSAMYTNQALWTMARENLDVTTIILNNGSYAILKIELERVGVTDPGEKALSLLDLTKPAIDWTAISTGMGVPAERVDTVEAFRDSLIKALGAKGPRLIEAII
ncbi:MAG: acetolactate synthase large subunit [Maricaulaceae bacterium]